MVDTPAIPSLLPSAAPEGVLDMAVVAQTLEMLGESYVHVLGLFERDGRRYLAQIELALANMHAASLSQAAHPLKSSAQQMGARRCSEIAAQMEIQSRQMQETGATDFTALSVLYPQLRDVFETSVAALKQQSASIP
jgi:HPt (histidine-containing phosphotransfer) domain-containing protein